MGNISVSLPADGTTGDVADYNTPINTIVNEFNGNIDNANIKSGAAIATSKLADDAGITTAKIANDAVTATKIDWASTGADAGIWWEELGRVTLGSAGDSMSLTSIPARQYLKILFIGIPSGGTINASVTFNSDTAANYAYRLTENAIGDSSAVSQTKAFIDSPSTNGVHYSESTIINISGQEKLMVTNGSDRSTAGATTAPGRWQIVNKWSNTSAQITRMDFANNGTGDFAAGTQAVVLGHN